MRHISFALTTEQFRNRTKTVTRRLGWKNLKPGTELMACEKCQGLKKGEKVKKLGAIRVIAVSRETLVAIEDEGKSGPVREGFPEMDTWDFIDFFCKHNDCAPWSEVTRIEFEYL